MRVEPKGFICDMCGERIPSMYECIKVTALKAVRGENNAKMSSDITSKTLSTNHLCEDCYYNKLERRII